MFRVATSNYDQHKKAACAACRLQASNKILQHAPQRLSSTPQQLITTGEGRDIRRPSPTCRRPDGTVGVPVTAVGVRVTHRRFTLVQETTFTQSLAEASMAFDPRRWECPS